MNVMRTESETDRALLPKSKKQKKSKASSLVEPSGSSTSSTEGISSTSVLLYRAQVLLLRSSVASVAMIVSATPKLFHPYLNRTLSICCKISARGLDTKLPDMTVLETECESCLSMLLSLVPVRLSAPVLVEGTWTYMNSCSSVGLPVEQPVVVENDVAMNKYTMMILGYFNGLSREDVSEQLHDLCILAGLLMEYRGSFGSSSAHLYGPGRSASTSLESNDTSGDENALLSIVDRVGDRSVIETCLELCLKLTESELKAWLHTLSTWKDEAPAAHVVGHTDGRVQLSVGDDAVAVTEGAIEGWRAYSRGTTFMGLLAALAVKLQSIFAPTMGLHWDTAVTCLERFLTYIEESGGSATSGAGKEKSEGNGKRKLADRETVVVSHEGKDASVRYELLSQAGRAMLCFHHSSRSSEAGFVDEVEYNW